MQGRTFNLWASFYIIVSMTLTEQLGFFLLFFFSVIFREVARGYTALFFGDTTGYNAGRLTANPLKHIDLFGTILIPLIFLIFKLPAIGWAKPMPIRFEVLKTKTARIVVASSGILANVVLIAISLLVGILSVRAFGAPQAVAEPFMLLAYLNIILVIFHVIPIPPLDGFLILSQINWQPLQKLLRRIATLNPLVLFLVILVVWNILYPLVEMIYALLAS